MLEAVHDESTEVLEDLGSKDLGEEVSQVLGGLDVDGGHDVFVAEALNPLLSAVDVRERIGALIGFTQYEWCRCICPSNKWLGIVMHVLKVARNNNVW